MRISGKGFLLFETVLFVEVLLCAVLMFHFFVIKEWNKKIQKVQEKRIKYDGVRRWKPY